MRNKIVSLVILAAVGASLPLATTANSETLRYGGFGSGKSPFYKFGMVPYMKRVAAKSKGALKIQPYLNTLGGAPELYENTKNGLADLAWIISAAQRGYSFPRSEVLSMPMVLEGYTNAQASVALWNLYQRGLLAKDFTSVVPLAFASMAPAHVITKGKMPSFASIKGMKLAVTSGTTARTARALGAVPVFTSVTDLYQTMSRGTVQGMLVGFTAVKFFRLDEVSDRHLVMPLDTPLVFIGMNKKKFDSLPASSRKILVGEAGAKLSGALGGASDGMIGYSKGSLMKNPKQKIRIVPESERPAWRKAVQPMIAQWIKATPNGAGIMAAYKAELAKLKAAK